MIEPRHQAQQRGLPGLRRTEQHAERTGCEVEINTLQMGLTVDDFAYVLQRQAHCNSILRQATSDERAWNRFAQQSKSRLSTFRTNVSFVADRMQPNLVIPRSSLHNKGRN
jgi:hypothetical protein